MATSAGKLFAYATGLQVSVNPANAECLAGATGLWYSVKHG
jgi:hypothetical protein